MDKRSVLIFGVGDLQKSIILRAKAMGLFVVGIDPCPTAFCKDIVDAFEIIGGQDYEGTLTVAKKYHISAVITAATDKPLLMMARIAKALNLPFYSEDTARWSTDKYQMKQRFIEGDVPHARGRLIHNAEEAKDLIFPLICKPRDNSGSRGVILCRDMEELVSAIKETSEYTKLDSILVEEFIEGQEYSIEGLHYNGVTEIIQFTEKRTTEFPYNVELGHKQPANLSEIEKEKIREIIKKIADCMRFENCPSHTELKINSRGIFVIETSPRLGGGFITSTLTPLSSGINMEDQLIHIALGETINFAKSRVEKASGVDFFSYKPGIIVSINPHFFEAKNWKNMVSIDFQMKVGDIVPSIKTGLDRYGQFIVMGNTRKEIDKLISEYSQKLESYIEIE